MLPERLRNCDPFVLGAGAATLGNLALVWSHRFVAAQDHLDHLASLRVLRRLHEGDPFFTARFRVVRALVPDLLSELVWFVALRPLDEVTAGHALVSLYLVALPLAWWSFLARFCAGDTMLLPLAPLLAVTQYYALGSTNFLLGLPLVFAGAALWDAARDSTRAAAAFVGVAALTWLAHVYDYAMLSGCAFACVAVGLARGRRPNAREWAAGLALVAGFAAAAVAVLGAGGEWHASEPPRFNLSPLSLARQLRAVLFLRGDLGGTTACVAALAAVPVSALVGWRGRREALRPVPAASAAVMLAALWLAPASLGGESSIKERFVVPAVMLLVAAVAPAPARWHRALAAVVFAALVTHKLRDELGVHARFDAAMRDVEARVLPHVARHASVLPVSWWRRRTLESTVHHHAADLAVLRADAYVPDLFDAPGQQVLRYRQRWAGELHAPEAVTPAALAGWDLLWAQTDDPDALVAGVRPCVTELARTGTAALYRIDARCAAPSAGRTRDGR